MDLYTNSVAGSGDGCAHAESADGSFAPHPPTAEGTSGIGLDQQLHPNQMKYLLQEPYKSPKLMPSGPIGMDHRRLVSSICLA